MSVISYTTWLCDPLGNHLIEVPDFYNLAWSWASNNFGAIRLSMPIAYQQYVRNPDGIIEVTRHIDGQPDNPPRLYFTRRVKRNQQGKLRTMTIHALDTVSLLDRRIIDYAAGTAYTNKTDYASDMIRAFVLENMGSSATNADRILSSAVFSVQAALNAGYSFNKQAARRNLLTVLQEVARTSYENGTAIYFDIVPTAYNPIALQFRVYSTIRGLDRSSTGGAPLTLSIEDGQLSEAEIEDDWTSERNAVRACGAGQEAMRITALREATRWRTTPFSRNEAMWGDPRITTTAGLNAAGDSVLAQKRPRRKFTGTCQQSDTLIIGRDLWLGDKISAAATGLGEGQRFDAYVNAASFVYSRDNAEQARVRLYSEAVL